MPIMPLIFILVFLGVLLFLIGLYYLTTTRQEKQAVLDRLTDFTEEVSPTSVISEPGAEPVMKKNFFNLLGFLGQFGQTKKEEDLSALRNKFLQAGFRNPRSPLLFWGSKIFLAGLFVFLALLVRFSYLTTTPFFKVLYLIVIVALIGFFIPDLWLKLKIRERKDLIFKGLPDALDMLVVCIEAGMGLDAALHRVAGEMNISNPVLAEELKQVTLEMRAGKQRQEAFRNLALRTDLEDLNSLVSLLIQTDKFGTSIGQALRIYAESMRDKRYQLAEEKAQKMVVKLIFPLAFFILPATVIVVLGPALIRIFRGLSAH
jgi:tight adherence protein C